MPHVSSPDKLSIKIHEWGISITSQKNIINLKHIKFNIKVYLDFLLTNRVSVWIPLGSRGFKFHPKKILTLICMYTRHTCQKLFLWKSVCTSKYLYTLKKRVTQSPCKIQACVWVSSCALRDFESILHTKIAQIFSVKNCKTMEFSVVLYFARVHKSISCAIFIPFWVAFIYIFPGI